MRLENKELIKLDSNILDYSKIDLNYYKSKKLMRLDICEEDLINNYKITEFALDKKWIDINKEILGTDPYLVGIDAWITLPPPYEIKNYDDAAELVSSQMWHRDCDNLRDLKVMTYLTDVKDENEGPFEIIEGSHYFNNFNPFRYTMGSSGMRIKNDYIYKKYYKKIKSFYGKAGTSFIVDTRSLHRGKTVKKQNYHRVLLQLYFSNHPFGKIKKYKKPHFNAPSHKLWEESLKKNNYYQSIFN